MINKEKYMNLPKGFKDFLPAEQIIRNEIRSVVVSVFERYGFNPLETPAIEYENLLKAKYAGGSEITKQIYQVRDRKGRSLALKYDQTVPLSRVYATNPQLGKPIKVYQIDRAWRDEFGTRDREFWQCDLDILGTNNILADFEIIEANYEIFKKLGLDVVIKINNRKLLNGILADFKVPKKQISDVLLSLDKLDRIGYEGVLKDVSRKGVSEKLMTKIIKLLLFGSKENSKKKLAYLKEKILNKEAQEGISELEQIFVFSKAVGIKKLEFSPTLSRGLEYYTGPVFEIYLRSCKVNGSLAAGGRYDEIIGKLIGSQEQIPAIGGTVGLSRIYDALVSENKFVQRKTLVNISVISVDKEINNLIEVLKLARQLRGKGYNTSLDLIGSGIKKGLKYADKKDIPFVAILGGDEIKKETFILRNMKSGRQIEIKRKELEKEKNLLQLP